MFIHYLLAGKWSIGFLNDADSIQPIRFAAALTDSARFELPAYAVYFHLPCCD